MTRARLAIACCALALLCLPASASAFGTLTTLGQHAEHEKITRVLSCFAVDAERRCLQPLTLDQLAGRDGSLGAVGAPDHPYEILGNGDAHCDDGDYLPGAPYPAARAKAAHDAIAACVRLFGQHLDEALAAAGDLASDSEIHYREAQLNSDCQFPKQAAGSGQRAKCRVLNGLGRALHAAEDFWSHSNWGDERGPGDGFRSLGVFDVGNPPGLLNVEVASFMRYPLDPAALPTQEMMEAGTHVISGCDDSAEPVFDAILGPTATSHCGPRVSHSHLNKDKGEIDWRTGAATSPSTSRGKIENNFQRAVTGARLQARAVWNDFRIAAEQRYGADRAGLIMHALTRDTPWTTCLVSGSSGGALMAPVLGTSGAPRTVTATIENRTGKPLDCAYARLNGGSWNYRLPPDTIPPQGRGGFRNETAVHNAGPRYSQTTHPRGSVRYRIGTTGYTVDFSWSNPYFGSNDFDCKVESSSTSREQAPYRCSVTDTKGNDVEPKFVVSNR